MQEESCDTFVAFKGDNTSLQRKGEGLGYPYQDQADQPLISTYVIDPKVPKPSAQLYGGDNNMASTSQSRCMELSSPPNSSDSSSTASPDGRKGKKEKKLKKWQIFPGRNKFLCGGRIIMAVSTGILNFTVCLIVFTVALFFAFECRLTLVTDIPYGFFIPIACAFIFIFNMSCLLRTAWSDPGIIPRALPDEAGFIEKISTENQRSDSLTPGYRPPPRVLEVIVNGVPMKLKYCFTCKIFRPPRASHCSLCDNCVENFDHHCPWVGNCVGKRNYKYFFLFVSSLTVLCIYIFTFCIVHIVLLTKRQGGFLNALKMSPGSVFEVLICFFSVWSVTGLTGFHSYLIALSLTTNEDIKGTWSKKRNQNVNNPFDRGSILKNCSYALCSPMPPSSIRRRDFATKEELEVHKKGVEQRLSGRSLTAQPRTSNGYPIADHEPYDSSQALYPRQYPPVPSLQPIPPAPSQGITQQNVAIAPSAAAAVAVSPSSVIENRQNDGSPSRYQLNSSPEVTKNTNGSTMTSPHPHNGAHHHHQHHHHGVGGYNFNNNGGQRNSGIESSSSTLSSSGSHSQPSSVVVVEHIGSPAPSPPPPPTTAPSRGDPNNASLNDSRAKLLRVDEKGESKSCKSVELKLG